jgi:glycosyltransferase involved in cell wall biosynthesis
MTRPRRLLYVVNDAGFFLSHRLTLALAAVAAGYEVHVATPQDQSSSAIAEAGLVFHAIPLSRKGTRPWLELRSLWALTHLYRRLRPDLVHHVTIKPVIYGGIAARLTRIPGVVNAVTGLGTIFIARSIPASLLRALVSVIYRFSLNHRNQRVIFQNPDDRDHFVGAGLVKAEDTTLIRGAGVDMGRFMPSPEPSGVPVIVLASRMIADKGIGEFVAAARELRGEGVHARFVLVGDTDAGNPTAIASATLTAWHEEGAVEWWGQCTNMPAVLAAAHIVCLPSYREGLPKVLVEAAACGRPLVTTDTPGCRDICRDQENGLLVKAKDAHSLAAALRRLIQDAPLRRRLGARARQIVEHDFSDATVIRQTLALYRELFA